MGRAVPSPAQNFLSSVVLPVLSILLLPVSILAVVACVVRDAALRQLGIRQEAETAVGRLAGERGKKTRCVLITGGRMSKGLTLARAFKRAGWKVIGVDEEGWGELCPMRFSSAVDNFYILPPAAASYKRYSGKLLDIARTHSVDLFIPVSGAGSSVEDAQAAEEMFTATKGTCRTFIQDPETMLDLHDKDRFMALVERLGFPTPSGKMIIGVQEAMAFLKQDDKKEPKFVLKCMGLDENRGDMTLYPLKGDDKELSKTQAALNGLRLKITKDCPYVFQEFIPGQEWCTHASVIDGRVTSFVTCPSNDMLMTYENATTDEVGRRAEAWTVELLNRLKKDLTPTDKNRGLTGHFSFDFILSTKNGEMYPLECNARVHTAVIMLPVDRIASCYEIDSKPREVLRPLPDTAPRSWLYNDLIMRYLPLLVPSKRVLADIHPSLPACSVDMFTRRNMSPNEAPFVWRKDPTLVADDWLPFIVLWHVWWPALLITRWWQGKKWNRLNVSTGRIFEA
ncbi:hypothetical protein IAU59_001443 [Kwoniella sp. CBS 9459]